MGDDIKEISTENDAFENKIGSYDKKWIEESKQKLLEHIDDEKRAKLKIFRLQKQLKKHKKL